MAKNTCARWISNVGFFKGCEEDFIVRLSLSLHPETFTPREKIITLGEESNRMFVVRQVRRPPLRSCGAPIPYLPSPPPQQG